MKEHTRSRSIFPVLFDVIVISFNSIAIILYIMINRILLKTAVPGLTILISILLFAVLHHFLKKHSSQKYVLLKTVRFILYTILSLLTYINIFHIAFTVVINIWPACSTIDGNMRCVMPTGQVAVAFLVSVLSGSVLLYFYIFKYNNILKR